MTLASSGALGPGLSPRAVAHIHQVLARLGVTVREHTRIECLEPGLAVSAAGDLAFDCCLWAGPLRVPTLAVESGLQANGHGQVLVDVRLRSLSHPFVWAAGDSAVPAGNVGALPRPACATATAMGAYLADSLTAERVGRDHPGFRLSYLAKNVSLGRRDGVIDWVYPDDRPRNAIWTGRLAALYKAFVGRYVVWYQLTHESKRSGGYQMPRVFRDRTTRNRTHCAERPCLRRDPHPTSAPIMDSPAALSTFERHRPRLFALAYRMLGSVSEAEDVLQDAYLRWQKVAGDAREPIAYLTTIVTRLCLDVLTSARARREAYVGPWLPEPLATLVDDPEASLEMKETISLAFLALLERLNPVERAVYLLRAVFDYEYAEIAGFVGKTEPACRQIFSRSQRFVRANRPRLPTSPEAHAEIFATFLQALATGDSDAMFKLLHDSVVVYGDGGGKAIAAREPIRDRALAARFLAGLHRLLPVGAQPAVEPINGWPALVIRTADGRLYSVTAIETDGHLIYAVRNVINPDKLVGLR